MAKIIIKKAKPDHAKLLVDDMREADVSELQAMHGDWCDLTEVVADGIDRSKKHCWTAFEGSKVLMIGGAAPGPKGILTSGYGIPWLLATNSFDSRGILMTKATRSHMAGLLKSYSLLANYVDARHDKSIRWLKRVGFTVAETTTPAGVYGMPFYSFWMRSYV